MSNLGSYQTIIKWSKAVKGSMRLLVLTACGGYLIGKAGEVGLRRGLKKHKVSISSQHGSNISLFRNKSFTVTSSGEDESGLKFQVGQHFKVLQSDRDAILIEKRMRIATHT
ncbi:hypothetical protein NRF22_03855 [Oenococcus kitaharae]|uniref:hypothetical protein n=1 Tax=Oenococcus TaxID=46254 RepID=UPI0021E6F60F|nr:hypothetical protein [Oenococcus kitaharae]MCV3296248.1 hypothetical protein [Oenococcus kitaharae]